jgi:hypothetical protein
MTIYYVSINGIDTNPGTLLLPYKTLQKGVDKLSPGDTLFLRGGNYNQKVKVNNSGTSSAPITVSPYNGEHVIIDGTGLNPNVWPNMLLTLEGKYINVKDIELIFPAGSVILVDRNASYCLLNNLVVHNANNNGVVIKGDNNIVENSKFYDCMKINSTNNHSWGGTIAIGESKSSHFGLNTIVRNCDVYQSWGEGILGMYTEGLLIDDNRVWDNWAEDIYLDQCSLSTVQNNKVYYTDDPKFWRDGAPASGIYLSNENLTAGYPVGHDRLISKNIISGAKWGIMFWTGYAPGSALINDTISGNTIVNFDPGSTGIKIGLPNNTKHKNTVISDNMIIVPKGTPIVNQSSTGITLKNNVEDINMSVLTDTQSLLTEIETAITGFQAESDTRAAEIVTAQQAKAVVDAEIVTYGQLKSKCQEMINLLLVKP